MKFIPLHTTNTAIVYKNSLCSTASVLVLVFVTLSIMLPILLVSLLSPYSGIAESRILYEQPQLAYQFQYLFLATAESNATAESEQLVACSSFADFNERMNDYSKWCESTKYSAVDLDHDTVTDRANFELQLETLPGRIKSFDLVLFFEAHLQHKCSLSPPAMVTHQLILPSAMQMNDGTVQIQAELKLKQNVEFTCPFPGRNTKTHFRAVQLPSKNSYPADLKQYQTDSLLQQVKANPAYFQLSVQETYYRRDNTAENSGLRIALDLDVLQLPARYHLSIWERLGQFWLYFASLFGISFYVMNRVKDFLFGRHIIRAWEIIPWKKLY